MNRNFGKLNGGAIEYGPDTLTIEGRKVYNPKAVHYRIAGYLPVVDASPSDPPREGITTHPTAGKSVTVPYGASGAKRQTLHLRRAGGRGSLSRRLSPRRVCSTRRGSSSRRPKSPQATRRGRR